MNNAIYADYNGSAPLCDDVVQYLIKRLQSGPFANPNAIHALGGKILMAMEKARGECARALGAKPHQLVFNSGSTEGISEIFFTLLLESKAQGKDLIITSGIEHSAVVNSIKFFEARGYRSRVLPTLPNGVVDVSVLPNWLKEEGGRTAMVAVMAANNETGVIQPYQGIAAICTSAAVPYFCDTTQLIGKAPFNFQESGIDYAVMSGHKVGALTGTGLLMARDPSKLKCLIIGGGQERNLRGGTQNYIGNETLAVALKYATQSLPKLDELRRARDNFEARLKAAHPKVVIFGEEAPRVASTTYLAYPGIHGQGVQIELESHNIFVTTSSACSDNEPVTSKVLKAMKVQDDVGRGAVRISLGPCSPPSQYDAIFDGLNAAFNKLSKIKSY